MMSIGSTKQQCKHTRRVCGAHLLSATSSDVPALVELSHSSTNSHSSIIMTCDAEYKR